MSRTIRASALPSWNDCARRTAAKSFRALVVGAGFELRSLQPSVGAAVGTAVHAAAEHAMQAHLDGKLPVIEDGLRAALETFAEEVAPGAEWDDTTQSRHVAEYQIDRMTRQYMADIAATIEPAAVELELRAVISPGWELTGHVDLLAADGMLRDLKTGALIRPYQAQLGAYSLLARSNGYEVTGLAIDFIQRSRKTKPQAPARTTHYPQHVAERAAIATIEAVTLQVAKFEETGDPYAFPANNMSLMCTARYCCAWGTKFCQLHSQEETLNVPVD